MKFVNRTETRVQYAPGEETYVQRQLREFFSPRAHVATPKAPWAEKFDPLNGKTAGAKEVTLPFGRTE